MKSVAGASGTAIEQVAEGIKKLQQAQAKATKDTSAQAEAFRQLGISAKQVSGDTGDLLGVVADKLALTQDGWQKNSVVMALFGKNGTDLLEFLNDYADRGESVAKITSDMAAQAESYERGMHKLAVVGNQFKEIFGLGVLPVADALVKQFVQLWTQTGKIDSANKEMMKATVTAWMWDFAKGVAVVVDIARGAAAIIRGLADSIAIIGVSVMGFWHVLQADSLGQMKTRFLELKATLGDMKTAADARLENFNPTAAQDFVTAASKQTVTVAPSKSNLKGIVAGVGDDTTDKAAKAKDLNNLLERANALYAAQVETRAKLAGEDSDAVKLQREFNDLIDKARAAGDQTLVAKLLLKKADAQEIEAANRKVELKKQEDALLLDANKLTEDLKSRNKSLLGIEDDRSKVAEQFDALIKKATDSKQTELVATLTLRQQEAIGIENANKQLVIDQKRAEFMKKMCDEQMELNKLVHDLNKESANMSFSSLVKSSKSPGEISDDEYSAQYQKIKDALGNKGERLVGQANDLRAKGQTNEADIVEKQAAEAYRQQDEALRKLGARYHEVQADSDDAWAGMAAGAKSFADSIPSVNNAFATFSEGVLNDFTNRLTDLFTTGKFGFKDFVKTAITELIKLQMQMMMMKMVTGAQAGATGGWGAFFSSFMSKADGGAFNRGVQFYANGDVFGSPTMFQHSGGLGVLGEAGPEAVMPLRRGSDGKLGVAMAGNTSGSVQVNNNISVTVQGGNNNTETGNAVAEAVVRKIADQRIYDATRSGGIIRKAMQGA